MKRYRIYKGDNAGGPIDYAAPIGSTAGTTFLAPAVPTGSRTRFGVRAHDDATGVEEKNVDATVELIVTMDNVDASDPPPPPIGVRVRPVGTDGAIVSWDHLPAPGSDDPDAFRVYLSEGMTPDGGAGYDHQVLFVPGRIHYETTLEGLEPGTDYAVWVRALRHAAEDAGAGYAVVRAKGSPPANVAGLSGRATYRG